MSDKPIKCVRCGYSRGQHNAMTKACPTGYAHRVVGHTSFHARHTFLPKWTTSKDKLRRMYNREMKKDDIERLKANTPYWMSKNPELRAASQI